MTTDEIKEKYLKYFISAPRSHREILASPLVLEDDPTTLFTSAGMQPLVPYLKGKTHPKGRRLVGSQPSFRSVDIEEVGDNHHTTYFEMLGNWSLGDYYKNEQLAWVFDFFTKELGFTQRRLWVSVFEGDQNAPKDEESYRIWRKLGIPESRISCYPAEKNWWSMTGTPGKMQVGDIGGPDSEIFYDLGEELELHEKSVYRKQACHPNCDCGRFIEVGNSVFIQYIKEEDGSFKELPQKNVDFGGGLERIAMANDNKFDIFVIDVFTPVIKALETETSLEYAVDSRKDKSFRIIADHLRAAVMLAAEGLIPSNKLQGYVLRRLLRRSIFHMHLLGAGISGGALVHAAESLKSRYKIVEKNWDKINAVIVEEGARFEDALQRGIRKLTKIVQSNQVIDGKVAFDLYQTEGFPLELTLEILSQNKVCFSEEDKLLFRKEFEKHKELSRTTSSGIFKGGLAGSSKGAIKLHTATHLLHQALRQVLGDSVSQKGSNITTERLRFDFSHARRLTDDEINKVEGIVNEQIEKELPVSFTKMTLDDAIKSGALHFFTEKYVSKVKVYTIGDHDWFSKEVCGGPHVGNTKEIGHVKIIKQEKLGTGIVRIYAILN